MSTPSRRVSSASEYVPCLCGCGNAVSVSKKYPEFWNDFYSRHTGRRDKKQFGKPPVCACGCGMPVTWGERGWCKYADHVPLVREIEAHYASVYSMEQFAQKLTSRESKNGISLRTLERRMKANGFPKPILARDGESPQLRKVFVKAEVDAYVREEQAKKKAKKKNAPPPRISKARISKAFLRLAAKVAA